MLLRLLALFRRPRVTDHLRHYRAQLERLQPQMDIVLAGLRRGDISIEDFLVQREE